MKPVITSEWENICVVLPYLGFFETRSCFVAIAFKLRFIMCHWKGQVNKEGLILSGTCWLLIYTDDADFWNEAKSREIGL